MISRAILSPLRSSSAFVATVVPMRIHSIWEESRGWSGGRGTPSSCVCMCVVCVCVNMHVYCIVKDLNLLVAVLDTT